MIKKIAKGLGIGLVVIIALGVIFGEDTTEVEKEQKPVAVVEQVKPEEKEKPKFEIKEEEKEEEKEEVEEVEELTLGQKNAFNKAIDYLNYQAFSKTGLIGQLEYEGFSTDEATYAVDNVSVDWSEQAVYKATEYLNYQSFSRQGLIDQLIYEGFTQEQAVYGVDGVGF